MKRRSYALIVCAFLLAALVLPCAASANSAAPDPVVTVKLKNLPDSAHTVALLDEQGKPYTEGESTSTSGGMPAFRFHGYHLPRTFTVALTNESGEQVTASAPYQRQSYYTTLVFDCATGQIVYATPVWLAYVIQFLCTCIPTLLIEGGLLLLFRFNWKQNRRLFLLLNLATQIFLTWCMAGSFIGNGSRGYPILSMVLAEVPIFIAEAIILTKHLKGQTGEWRVTYALAANSASLAFGLLTNSAVFALLQRI